MKVRLLTVRRRRAGRRCFRSIPSILILLFVGVLVTFTVLARQYGGWDNTGNYQLQENSLTNDGDADQLHALSRSQDTQRALRTDASIDARVRLIADHRSQACQSNRLEVSY